MAQFTSGNEPVEDTKIFLIPYITLKSNFRRVFLHTQLQCYLQQLYHSKIRIHLYVQAIQTIIQQI